MSYISAIRQGENVVVWERNELGRQVNIYPAPYYFYTKQKDGQYTSMYGDTLKRHNFKNSRDFYQAKKNNKINKTPMFESDIPVELKVLSQHYYDVPAPKLNVSFLDIEVDYDPIKGFSSPSNPYAPINSIAIYHQHEKRMVVLAVPPDNAECDVPQPGVATAQFYDQIAEISPISDDVGLDIVFCKNERELLMHFISEIEDSDVLSGWNSDFFDMPYIGKRLELMGKRYFQMLSFNEGLTPEWREVFRFKQPHNMLDLSGRVSLDYLDLFRKYEVAERRSYKLESIADEVLPELPKLKYNGSLAALYRKDFAYFIRYNIRDTEILKGFEDRLGYVALANEMVHLSTGDFKHVGGVLKLAELASVNYCHHKLGGVIVNDVQSGGIDSQIQGAMVLQPQSGLHEWVGSIDLNSLYPSVIRSINISPETIRGQFTDNVDAAVEFAKGSDTNLVFRYESGVLDQRTAREWREIFTERCWACSGYGTAFDQTKQGIIPKILEDWYAQRKTYKKKMNEAKQAGDHETANYYDRLQYVYKIKLNSFYGALTNAYFRFFDLRMGESTTGTGRMILKHQCAKANEILTTNYDMNGAAIVYGDSVAGDTNVETPNGTIEIQQLFHEVDYSKGDKQYSNSNQSALTFCPHENKNVFRPIKYVVRHKVHKKMYRVWISSSRYIDVTEDHALIGYGGVQGQTPRMVEVKPTELGTNGIDWLVMNSHLPHNTQTDEYNSELIQLTGLVIGYNGDISEHNTIKIKVDDRDINDIIQHIIDPLIHQKQITSFNQHDNYLHINSSICWDFIHKFTENGNTNTIPTSTYDLSNGQIQQFVRGYFTAAGFAESSGMIGIQQINYESMLKIYRLLLKCGVAANYWVEQYRGVKRSKLLVYSSDVFSSTIGFITKRKSKFVSTIDHEDTPPSGYVLIAPAKIEQIQYDDYVYDIEVGDTHTFYANDLLVHNTDSTYFKTFANDAPDAIEVANGVGDLVNDSFNKFMQESFLVTPTFNGVIACACEVVSDRGIFVDKKRYILHTIYDEGFDVDKLKVMGLDTKRTTMPKHVADKLNKFIERFLRGEDWSTISQDIVEYKDELTNSDVMRIGLPKGIKGIEQYTADLSNNDATFLPGHVSAGIFYNKCLKEFNDKQSIPIVSGMKIYVFYLKHKVGRFKSIAIPVDIETVPTWFMDNFEVDKAAHIQRLIDKPLTNIINCCGELVPTKQSLMVDSLLEF